MYDPVSGFKYPEEWIELCQDKNGLNQVHNGLAVLTSDGFVRRRGFTTGTSASAAAKAAVISLGTDKTIGKVTVLTPVGINVEVPVVAIDGMGLCKKYSGDYPGDVTAGIEFKAVATPVVKGISLTFGEGIGRWERATPRYKKGDPAVSFVVMKEIWMAMLEGLTETDLRGFKLHISAPQGVKISEQTLNRIVGVTGGISILGTTGFVEPWDDHLEQTVSERVTGAEKVVLTTGRVGMRYSRLLFPDYEVVLAGSRLSGIVSHTNRDLIICGLPALVLKFINPSFLNGTGYSTVEEFMEDRRFNNVMEYSLQSYKEEHPNIRVVIVNRGGRIIGDSG